MIQAAIRIPLGLDFGIIVVCLLFWAIQFLYDCSESLVCIAGSKSAPFLWKLDSTRVAFFPTNSVY